MNKNEKLTIKVYRHKEEKNVFLIRNWGIFGGTKGTDFYKVTTDLIEAVKNVAIEKNINSNFEEWMSHFDGKLYVKFKKKINVEVDGYTGTLEKEIKLYVQDFEKVILTEV